jgi:hypothetical protein
MTLLSLHCDKCAYIGTTTKDAMAHVTTNPTHTVRGDGPVEGTTLTINVTKDRS